MRSPITIASIRRKTRSSSSPAMSSPMRSSELAQKIYGAIPARGEAPKRFRRARAGAARASARDARRRKGRAADASVGLSRALLSHGEARRGGSARSARPSSRRRPDEPLLQGAGRRAARRRLGRRALCAARRSTTRASMSTGCRRRASRSKRSTREVERVIAKWRMKASAKKISPAPRRGSSPMPSMRRTIRRRSAAGMARRSRAASRVDDVLHWPEQIEAVTVEDVVKADALARQAAQRHGLPSAGDRELPRH